MTLAGKLLPERQCHRCTRQVEWGCERDAVIPLIFDGEEIKRCPKRPFLENPVYFNDLYMIHHWVGKGYLPDPGTYEDQGAKLPVLLYIIDAALSEADETIAAKHRAAQDHAKAAERLKGGDKVNRPGGARRL